MSFSKFQTEVIISTFIKSFANADAEERLNIARNFELAFSREIDDFREVVKQALAESDSSREVIDSWNEFVEKKEAVEVSCEISEIRLEDEKEINKLLAKELSVMPRFHEFNNEGTIKEFMCNGYSFVAREKGELIGVLLAQRVEEYGTPCVYVNIFAVKENWQGRRVGTAMMNHLFHKVSDNRMFEIKLATYKTGRAYEIYHHWGFADQPDDYVYLTRYVLKRPHRTEETN